MPNITTCLWFDDRAEEAARFYVSVFKDAKMGSVNHYPDSGQETHGKKAGSVMVAEFSIGEHKFVCLNGGPQFKFTEAISLMIPCKDQKEIDYYWETLTANGGQEGPCGWLKDKYGLSWQVFPETVMKMLNDPDRKRAKRVMDAFMTMHKFDVAEIERAYAG
ncbi:MAG TPA: VOC family protein [Dongiaceae bacterium]|jgi:predicted 3-demethylubiquinone-9 3-methyltransferase (glyoxalase superfamily)|nr:VOC family protein [Dongiaceae bacterium]